MTDPDPFIASVAKFAHEEIAPAAASWCLGQKSPDQSLYLRAAEIGLTGIELPQSKGGLGLGFRTKACAFAALAACDFGFAMSVINTHNVALRLCLSAPADVQDNTLPGLLHGRSHACTALTEPTAGSDVAALQTQAIQQNDRWILNGEKSWIVNARHADLAIVFAQTDAPGNSHGIAAFLVDLHTTGVERYPIDSGFSQTSIGTGGFRLQNVEVDSSQLLLEPGKAFKSILNEINGARVYVAAMCDAMLDAALHEARRYGQLRHTFGKPLHAHDSWQQLLDTAEHALQQAQTITDQACQRVDDGGDAQLPAIMAKVGSVETCQAHLPKLLHAMGAEGLLPQYCFTRHLAAAQMAALTDGATNMLRERAKKISSQ